MYVEGDNQPVQTWGSDSFPKPPSGPVGLESTDDERSWPTDSQNRTSQIGVGKIFYPPSQYARSEEVQAAANPRTLTEAYVQTSHNGFSNGPAELRDGLMSARQFPDVNARPTDSYSGAGQTAYRTEMNEGVQSTAPHQRTVKEAFAQTTQSGFAEQHRQAASGDGVRWALPAAEVRPADAAEHSGRPARAENNLSAASLLLAAGALQVQASRRGACCCRSLTAAPLRPGQRHRAGAPPAGRVEYVAASGLRRVGDRGDGSGAERRWPTLCAIRWCVRGLERRIHIYTRGPAPLSRARYDRAVARRRQRRAADTFF